MVLGASQISKENGKGASAVPVPANKGKTSLAQVTLLDDNVLDCQIGVSRECNGRRCGC